MVVSRFLYCYLGTKVGAEFPCSLSPTLNSYLFDGSAAGNLDMQTNELTSRKFHLVHIDTGVRIH